MKIKQAIFGLILLLLPVQSFAEPATKESIVHLMELTGSGDMGIKMVDQMLPLLKKLTPKAPSEFWSDFRKDINPQQLVDMIVPVYQKHFDEKDMQELIAFYNTRVGKKFIRVQPVILQESMAVGQAWGRGIAEKILRKYKAEYENK
jgi:hypothetical protein